MPTRGEERQYIYLCKLERKKKKNLPVPSLALKTPVGAERQTEIRLGVNLVGRMMLVAAVLHIEGVRGRSVEM